MRLPLLLSILTITNFSLFALDNLLDIAAISQTDQDKLFEKNCSKQNLLDIYSQKSPSSNKIATISTLKGKLVTKNCSETRDDGIWCKVEYENDDIELSGYICQRKLKIAESLPKNKKTFQTHFGGRKDDVGKAILALDDGAIVVGYTGSYGSGGDDAYIVRVDNFGNKIFSLELGGVRDEVLKAIVKVDDGFMVAGTSRSIGNARDNVYLAKISNSGQLKWDKGFHSGKRDYFRANDMISIADNKLLIIGNEEKSKMHSSNNCYLNIIDTDGERSIVTSFGGKKKENANSVVQVSDGYVLAGETSSWGNGSKDGYVVKVNKKGQALWHRTYGYEEDESINQIIKTSDNGFILVGTTESDVQKQKDIFIVKISVDGIEQWKKSYGTREDEEGFGIVEVDDGYVVAGYTEYTANLNSDVYILKVDKKGQVVFTRTHGNKRDDKAFAIAKDNDGFVLTGYTITPDTYSKNIYVLRVNNEGTLN